RGRGANGVHPQAVRGVGGARGEILAGGDRVLDVSDGGGTGGDAVGRLPGCRPRLSAPPRQEPDRRRLEPAMPLRLVPPIHRATHRIGLYLAGLKDEALSQGEAHILALLATSGPATIADLHRGLAHKRSTLTSILDRLAARGFVTRAVGAADRRTFVIAPTAKGASIARR